MKDDYTIMKVEPFGPLVPMLSFKEFDEVIERANNHELDYLVIFARIQWKEHIGHLS